MPSSKAKSKIKPSPIVTGEEKEKKVVGKKPHPLIESCPKNFGIGQAIQPKRDLNRFVKWPKYVRLQRQEKILRLRLKAPPAINQFNVTADPKLSSHLLRFAKKYAPETKKEKTQRLLRQAQAKINAEKSGSVVSKDEKPCVLKYGLNHVTSLIEKKKALLVLIARDVYPIELIVWLPALCRKMGIPYVIVKSKSALGSLIHQKTATCVCFNRIRPEHNTKFKLLLSLVESTFAKNIEIARKKWSTPVLSSKTNKMLEARAKAAALAVVE